MIIQELYRGLIGFLEVFYGVYRVLLKGFVVISKGSIGFVWFFKGFIKIFYGLNRVVKSFYMVLLVCIGVL